MLKLYFRKKLLSVKISLNQILDNKRITKMKNHIFIFTEDITLDGGVERVVSNMANSFSKRG